MFFLLKSGNGSNFLDKVIGKNALDAYISTMCKEASIELLEGHYTNKSIIPLQSELLQM